MKVKELIEMLKECDENREVRLIVEKGRGYSGSEDFEVNDDGNVVYLSGEEDFYD